ncbi:MAG: FecR domain-containing protein [Bdellovibrionaceae bacterium]|nr:FecR domain-containing protein [Pseudobdellovibrionaceae bacterium]
MRIFAFLIVALTASQTFAEWKLQRIQGNLELIRNGQSISTSPKLELKTGDIVKTDKGSRVQLVDGENQLWLGPGSTFTIQESQISKSQVLNLLYGKMRAVIQKGEGRKYRFKTKSVVAGVRGTEFFMSSEEEGDFVCTLEGEVQVTTKEGDKISVTEGKGLRVAKGENIKLSDNSPFLVQRWIAETDFDSEPLLFSSSYQLNYRKHELGPFFTGLSGSLYYCDSIDKDFSKASGDNNYKCFRSYITPFLQYGVKDRLFFRPAVVTTNTEMSIKIDSVPEKIGKSAAAFTLAEAFAELERGGWDFKLGYQDVEWNDGVLLSRRLWTLEPTSHLALRINKEFNDWELELLGGPGVEDKFILNGHSHIKTLGAKISAPSNMGNIFVLHNDFGEWEAGKSPYVYGHEIVNYGFYSNNKISKWDYQLSGIYQKHLVHHNANGDKGSAAGSMLDITLGRQTQWLSSSRIFMRYLLATKNFISVLEDYYKLGAANITSFRSNLSQWRLGLDTPIRDTQSLKIEYFYSYEVSDKGFVRQLKGSGENLFIGWELDALHYWKINSHLNFINGLWYFHPSLHQPGSDGAYGWISRLDFTL